MITCFCVTRATFNLSLHTCRLADLRDVFHSTRVESTADSGPTRNRLDRQSGGAALRRGPGSVVRGEESEIYGLG